MQIDLREAPERVTVLAPRGRLDITSASAFRQRLHDLVAVGVTELVVDLSNVTFLDSSGLAAVIGGLKAARQAGGDLRIARPNQQALTLLDVTSMDLVFRPFVTVEEALTGVATSAEEVIEADASAEALGAVHEGLRRFWRSVPIADDQWRMMFELAVSEIAANILEHARPPAIQLRLRVERDHVLAEFTDAGIRWNGSPEPADFLGSMAERGRGLALARMAVDHLLYERVGARNRWRLLKRI